MFLFCFLTFLTVFLCFRAHEQVFDNFWHGQLRRARVCVGFAVIARSKHHGCCDWSHETRFCLFSLFFFRSSLCFVDLLVLLSICVALHCVLCVAADALGYDGLSNVRDALEVMGSPGNLCGVGLELLFSVCSRLVLLLCSFLFIGCVLQLHAASVCC